MNIDVVEVVEVLSVESSEDKHAAAEETSTMSSSGFGSLPGDFQTGDCISLGVQHEDIAEIIAEPASVDVYFILVYCWGVSPACHKSAVLHASFAPGKSLSASSFEKTSKVYRIDVAEAAVLGVASSNHVELVSQEYWRMESSSTGPGAIFIGGKLYPAESVEVECPQVV